MADAGRSHAAAGQGGTQLKWISARPDSDSAVVTAAQHVAPTSSARALRTAQKLAVSDSADAAGTLSAAPSSEDSLQPFASVPMSPSMERQNGFEERCPSPKDLKKLKELTTNIDPPPDPPGWPKDRPSTPQDCPLGNAVFQPRSFAPITFTWTASALCHKPLYFEDVQLERYGHMWGPWLQPFMSGGRFFLTIPVLPYKMGVELPNECMYTLGYYRPGDCAPYLLDPIPLSVRGALFEAGAWVGAAAAF
jgi:hypothetical protein